MKIDERINEFLRGEIAKALLSLTEEQRAMLNRFFPEEIDKLDTDDLKNYLDLIERTIAHNGKTKPL